jgi:OmpA-OmpF porin, OOP family
VPGSLTVKGFYQRETDKAEVLTAAAARFPGETVNDLMVSAAGAPACYTKAVDLTMLQLSRLIFGTSELVDNTLTIRGEAQTEVAAAEIKAATEAISADGCTGTALITVRAPEPQVSNDECQALFKDVLGKGAIQFDRDKADIKAESFGRLDNLAFVAKRCPDARVDISAHADSDASTAYNQALSERRAKSVVDYLVNSGVGPGRLTAVGYGETRPLVPNTNRDNKAKNRRVEFNVQ